MKKLLAKMYTNARDLNDQYFKKAIKETGPHKIILDIGCWDGELTKKYKKIARADVVYGIEVVENKAKEACKNGVDCRSVFADKDRWPFDDNSIDCVMSNQVIEHLSNVDHFISEAHRVLRKDGVFITSTNNLSSWHNIGALMFGWAPFDLSNSSKKISGLGNPLSVHSSDTKHGVSWTHKCVYTPRWLFDWFNIYGFRRVKLRGAGFYPLPAILGNIFKNHGAFFILTVRK